MLRGIKFLIFMSVNIFWGLFLSMIASFAVMWYSTGYKFPDQWIDGQMVMGGLLMVLVFIFWMILTINAWFLYSGRR